MGLTKPQKIVLCVVILIFLIIGWGMFPLFFKWLMIELGSKGTKLEDFGTLGDIYGSLNTLFTSATLLIVIYTAYLQRQANEDTRKAMAEQLEHAKSATAKQLLQANEATNKQLSQARIGIDLQLLQARESTEQQLALAQATHDAQIRESRHAIFSNTFNIFLSQKKTVLESIAQGNGKYKPRDIFNILGQKFNEFLKKESEAANKSIEETRDFLFIQMKSVLEDTGIQKVFSFNELVSYFYINISLLNLIKYSSLTESEKEIYYKLLSHSMTHEEQLTFLWFLFFSEDLKVALTDTYVIDSYFSPDEMDFIVKHFEETYFFDPEIRATWNEYLNDKVTETPA